LVGLEPKQNELEKRGVKFTLNHALSDVNLTRF